MEVDGDSVNLDWGDRTMVEVNKFTLIGKIITNKGAVKSLLLRSWNLKGEVSISDLKDNLFLFNFFDEDDFVRVVSDSPWTSLGNLLVLSKWSELLTIDELAWSKCQFWV